MSLTLDHLALVTATREANAEVAEFFRDVLGMPVHGDAIDGYAEVDAGVITVSLHTGAMADLGPIGGTLLQLRCPDVRREAEAIRGRGGQILLEPVQTDWGTLTAYVAGPHGVVVELYEPVSDGADGHR